MEALGQGPLAARTQGPEAPRTFARRVGRHRRRNLHTYVFTLSVATVLFGATVAIVELYATPAILQRGATWPTLTVFACGLAGFAVVGYAQLQTMMLISLARPGLAAQAELAGIVVMLAVGVPLARVDYRYLGPAFVLGALTFAALATVSARGLTRDAYPSFVAAV